MQRRYTTSLFQQRVESIKRQIPHAFVGVDVIAGMNGEHAELFDKSYRFIAQLDVSQLHAFPYSARANTRALSISGVVPIEERKSRTQKLIQLSEMKLRTFYLNNLGRISNVLFENQHQNKTSTGWTENYIKVEVPYQPDLLNTTRLVRLSHLKENGLVAGELL
jgi:threonylcarbamoyladenosine tRNA methylthiotransferase MtaB